MKAIHFAANNLRLGYGDGRHIRTGKTLRVNPDKLEPCVYGLHAAIRPIDALRYSAGNMICLVELGGKIIRYGSPMDNVSRLCASERTCLSCFNGETLLREFARKQALINIELIKPFTDEYNLIVRFLKTGDEKIRAAAWAAARDAARAAAFDAASAAASAATSAAAFDAAFDAACDSACDAAWAAVLAATNDAAWIVARPAVSDAASDAARAAASDAANTMLTEMIAEETGWNMGALGR